MTTANSRSTDYPIDPLFLQRWSPRSFTAAPMSEYDLMTILEAARWAPSAFNSQPWRFIYARRDTEHWPKLLGLLTESNRSWAKNASALIILVSKATVLPRGAEKEVPSWSHSFDAGAAWCSLALQAHLSGWAAHGMVGFDRERAVAELGVPDGYRVEAAIAIGRRGEQVAPARVAASPRAAQRPGAVGAARGRRAFRHHAILRMASMSASSSERDEQGAARVAAIVLAAGRSSRMGPQNKLLADLGGKPMVRRVVETALVSRAQPVLVVTGHMAAEVAAAIQGAWASQIEQRAGRVVPSPLVGEGQGGGESREKGSDPSPLPYRLTCGAGGEGSDPFGVPPTPNPSTQGGGEPDHVTLVPNADYATGLASSLRAGIRAVPADCDGALILLGDMPRIAPEHLDRLLDAFAAAPEAIVVPVHDGRQGNPVLWPRRYFPDLMQLEGDGGAKPVIAAHREHVREVPMGTSAIFADVDTPEELARLLKSAQ